MLYLLFLPLVILVTCFQKKRPMDDKRPKDFQSTDVSNDSQSGRGTVSATTRSSNVDVCNQPMVVTGLPSIPSSMPPSSTSDEKKEERNRRKALSIPKKECEHGSIVANKKSAPSLKSTQQTHTSSSADLLIETMTKGQDSLFDKTVSYDREGHIKRSQKYTRSVFKKKKKIKPLKTMSTCGNSTTALEKTQPNSDQLTPDSTQGEALTLTSSTTQKTTEV